jgi:hypothetical protein
MRLPNPAVRAVLWSQWAFWCALAISVWAYADAPPGALRATLVLTPVAPGLLIFAVTYWLYKSCDEYVRLRILQAGALTAVIIGALSMIWLFLELLSLPKFLGLPNLGVLSVYLVGWIVFDAQMLWLYLRAR